MDLVWKFVSANLWYIVPLTVILLLALVYRKQISRFYGEVRGELAKCTWPWDPEQSGFRKYKVLIDSTLVVCVASLLLAGYTTGFDFVISNLVTLLTRVVTGAF
ncbi:MAG: preprotein translocase subunit SecE [Verrucomicrobiales bacterium]|jgi:preprotein translocase subunit SecE|nr:preprotein translocase subunit SecE [Verrucomicrobiales bacterium]